MHRNATDILPPFLGTILASQAHNQERQRTAESEQWQQNPHGPVTLGSPTDTASAPVISADAERALQRLARHVATLLQAPVCVLAMCDAMGHALLTAHSTGAETPVHPAQRILFGQGIIGGVAADRVAACSDDLHAEPRYAPTDGALGSLLCLPLLAGKDLVGTLTVRCERVHAFGPRHVACAEALAEAAALVIAPPASGDAAQANQRLTVLVEAAQAITSTLEPQAIVANIVAGIHQMVPCDDSIIYAYDSLAFALQVVASQGQRSAHLCGERVSLRQTDSLSVRVAHGRQPMRHKRQPAGQRVGSITEAFLAGEDLSLLCVPLVSKDALHGVIMLARKAAFTAQEEHQLGDLAPLVATALENASLYAALHAEQAEKSRVLQMISHEIRAPLHTLNGYLDLLLSGITGTLDDRQRQMVQRARSSGERVASQVHDLLVMAYEDARHADDATGTH